MKRLTSKNWETELQIGVCGQDTSLGHCEVYNECYKYIKRLAELEDMIEDGNLIKVCRGEMPDREKKIGNGEIVELPCTARYGQYLAVTVYMSDDNEICISNPYRYKTDIQS